MTDDEFGEAVSEASEALYRQRLREFDAATCEALAVSQFTSGQCELPAVGTSTHVFGRICSHAKSILCAAPKSRWTRREFEIWDVSTCAAHARSIIEGNMLFQYLIDAPKDLGTQHAYLLTMHLYDCNKRIEILPHILSEEQINEFIYERNEIIDRIKKNHYFQSLTRERQKKYYQKNI